MEKNAIVKKQKSLIEQMAIKVENFKRTKQLLLPENYSAENALKAAGLMLSEVFDKDKKPVLETCTAESIGNSLLKMVTLGLNPMKHCSFQAYGNKLSCDENYQGKAMRAKRDAGVKTILSRAVYKDDVENFEVSIEANTGVAKVTKHETKIGASDSGVAAAYCIITMNDGSVSTTIMDYGQIENAWKQRYGGKLSPAHINFPDEMARKTVEKRALKPILESLGDNHLFVNEEVKDKPLEDIKQEVESQEYVEFEEVQAEQEKDSVPEKKETPKAKEANTEEDPF